LAGNFLSATYILSSGIYINVSGKILKNREKLNLIDSKSLFLLRQLVVF